MKVVKRDGKSVDFDREKVRIAIRKANDCVAEDDRVTERQIENIVKYRNLQDDTGKNTNVKSLTVESYKNKKIDSKLKKEL